MSDAMQHGLAKSGVYRVWIGMKGRCYSPGNPRFATHGGRGTDRPAVAAEFLGLPRLVGGTRLQARPVAQPHRQAEGLHARQLPLVEDLLSQPRLPAGDPCRRPQLDSLSEAVRETPRAHAWGIHRVTKGLQKTCGGYGWRFAPEKPRD